LRIQTIFDRIRVQILINVNKCLANFLLELFCAEIRSQTNS
jgi:hypothetical protein